MIAKQRGETMAVHVQTPAHATEAVYYPETDGKPMAESDLHREIMFFMIHLLQRFFAGQPVYVSGNLLLYYEKGNPRKSVAPDCFVVFGVEPRRRRVYKLWEEGHGPEIVFEVSSHSTQRQDVGKKMQLYAQLGVREYFIYDPTADYLNPPLVAFELVAGAYQLMQPAGSAILNNLLPPLADHRLPAYVSRVLGLLLTLDSEGRLQFYNLATNQRLLTDEEARLDTEVRLQQAAQRVIQEVQRASQEARRASYEAARASQEAQRATQAEVENTRLKAELAKLRGEN
ncbi:MAG: Uma2 family endonuclease [Chloroflexota bacterium]|nr:Uma2 family endonuclease [Chloroflexota bacterium]